MSAKAHVVPMTLEHLSGVTAIEKLSNSAPWSERSFRSEIDNPQSHYFVMTLGDAVVGFAGFWTVIDEAHITNVALHPSHRGKGLGRRLVLWLLDEAKRLGMTCATLEVRAGNEVAIALYERLGFQRCAVRRRYYPNDHEDAVIMWHYGLASE